MGASAPASQGDPCFIQRHRKADAHGGFLSQGVQRASCITAKHAYSWGHIFTSHMPACRDKPSPGEPGPLRVVVPKPERGLSTVCTKPYRAAHAKGTYMAWMKMCSSQLASFKTRSPLHLKAGHIQEQCRSSTAAVTPFSTSLRLLAAGLGIRRPEEPPA